MIEAAPDLRHEQADIVIDAHVWAHVTRRRREAAKAGEDVAD